MDPLTQPGRDFWHGVLAAGGSTTLPRWTLDPVPGVADHETPIHRKTLVAARRMAYDLGVPLRSLVLAAHTRVLAALSGERDVVVGYLADAAVRPLPCLLSSEPASWRALVEKTRRTESALRVYAGFPVDDLRRELALASPAFETVFDLAGAADVSGDAVLYVSFPERNGGRMLRLRYRTDVLDAASAARIAGYHLTARAQVLADPDAEHRRQSLLSADDIRLQLDGFAGPARELPACRHKALTELASELDAVDGVNGDGDGPATPTERRLAAAWAEVLGVPQGQVGRRDHFFDRGGTSLSAVKLVIALDRAVSPKDVLLAPVLADLAERLDGGQARRAEAAPVPCPQRDLMNSGHAGANRTPQNPLTLDRMEGDRHALLDDPRPGSAPQRPDDPADRRRRPGGLGRGAP
jgi:hypothetical protein